MSGDVTLYLIGELYIINSPFDNFFYLSLYQLASIMIPPKFIFRMTAFILIREVCGFNPPPQQLYSGGECRIKCLVYLS